MKIRLDYVTNSSSSGFIIITNKKIESLEDVSCYIENPEHAQRIFKKLRSSRPKYIKPGTKINRRLINRVCGYERFNHICESGGLLLDDKIVQEYDHLTTIRDNIRTTMALPKGVVGDDILKSLSKRYFDLGDKRDLLWMTFCDKLPMALAEKSVGNYVYHLEIGDEDGEGDLEHGRVFVNFPAYVRESHH